MNRKMLSYPTKTRTKKFSEKKIVNIIRVLIFIILTTSVFSLDLYSRNSTMNESSNQNFHSYSHNFPQLQTITPQLTSSINNHTILYYSKNDTLSFSINNSMAL